MGEYELSMINKARKLQADLKDLYISTNSIKRINKRLTDIGGLSYQGLTDILVQKDNFENPIMSIVGQTHASTRVS